MSTDALDIRLRTDFPRHPKVKRLRRRLGSDGYIALITLYLAARESFPSGVFDSRDPIEDLELAAEWPGDPGVFAETALDCGLLDRAGDGSIRIHDWEDHQPWASGAEARAKRSRKAALTRWGDDRASLEQCSTDAKSMLDGCSTHAAGHKNRMPGTERYGTVRSETERDAAERIEAIPEKVSVPEGTSPAAPRASGPPCPVQKIIDLHNEARPEAPPASDEPELRKSIVARWKQDPARQDLGWWGSYFHRVERSDFLSGRTEGLERPFVASLAWLVGPKNMSKVLAGNYENRGPPPGANRYSKIGRKASDFLDSLKIPEPAITVKLDDHGGDDDEQGE